MRQTPRRRLLFFDNFSFRAEEQIEKDLRELTRNAKQSCETDGLMNEDALHDFSGTVRLFPLPNLVLFPHVVQGLHIFESRYRQMASDALADDRYIAIVLLKSEEDTNVEHPAIESVACLGQIIGYEKLQDGRFNLRLRGVCRVRIIEELPTDRLYRSARVELLEDTAGSDLAALTRLRHDLATAVLPQFAEDSPARQQLQELFDGDMPLGQVCDILSYALPLPTEMKQLLLAESRAERRASAITDALRISSARADRPFPPPFSAN